MGITPTFLSFGALDRHESNVDLRRLANQRESTFDLRSFVNQRESTIDSPKKRGNVGH